MLNRTIIIIACLTVAGCNDTPEQKSETVFATQPKAMMPAAQTAIEMPAQKDLAVMAIESKISMKNCAELREKGPSEEVMIDEFLPDFPKDLIDPAKVENFDLSPADLDKVTRNLACAAALSGFGPDVPESALALFESKRYGVDAMAGLKKQAKGSTAEAKAAAGFVEQMVAYLEGPSE